MLSWSILADEFIIQLLPILLLCKILHSGPIKFPCPIATDFEIIAEG